ncbi:MAG: hypothetical protein JXX28_18375 [Deltaproteobacteria bacterium]|nr:hypothetical protein [Deltaproteobacteria bacterium]
MYRLGLALLGLVACNEYGIEGDPNVFGTPNPPDLSTPVKTDRIVQVTVPAVDVLWVVDNSGSMSEEQGALTTNFGSFIRYFVGSGLDWHLGVVSTDMNSASQSGQLIYANGVRYLDPTSPNPESTFAAMANLGTSGSADEQGLGAVWTALVTLRNSSANQGFYRDDAFLAVIAVSDEDDHTPVSIVSQGELTQWMNTHKPADNMTSFSSIVGGPGGCSSGWGDAEYGRRYYEVTQNVGGIFWSICDPDWSTVLEQLAMQAAGLKREFFLSEVPVEDTLHVWVEDDAGATDYDVGLDWDYSRSRNSITFRSYVPEPLSEVFIEYELLAAYQPVDEEVEAAE